MRRNRFTTTIVTINKIFWHFIKRDTQRMNNAIYDGFSDLGGVYVKFLQLLTMRSDFFVQVEQSKRLAVYDDVEADALDLDFVLNHELGDKVNYFKTIEREPFAAGSFGQVYRATFHDDRQVIMKILRPSLMQNLTFDLRLLRFFSFIIKFVAPSTVYDINEVFRDFRKVVTEETDYVKEAHNANHFYERYKNHKYIVIPQTYLELSTKYIITQDFLEGVPVTKLIESRNEGADVEEFMRTEYHSNLEELTWALGFELLYSVLTADLIQGDPHPGNVKIMPNNRIGIMDFGITAPPPDDRRAFLEVLKDYVGMYHGDIEMGKFFMDGLRFYAADLYRAMNTFNRLYARNNGKSTNDEDRFSLTDEVQNVARKAFNDSKQRVDVRQALIKGQVARIFEQTLNEDNRFGLKFSFDGGVMMRAATTYMSIVDGLGYREKIIPDVFEAVINAVEDSDVEVTGRPDTMEIDRAVEIVSDWIEDITERDPFLFRDLILKMRRRLKTTNEDI